MFKHKLTMVKTITITEEAYERIKSNKLPNESFSKMFMREFEKKLNISEIPKFLSNLDFSENDVDELRKGVNKFRKDFDKDFRRRQDVFARQLNNNRTK
jgi:predicted CopG family antitoxin